MNIPRDKTGKVGAALRRKAMPKSIGRRLPSKPRKPPRERDAILADIKALGVTVDKLMDSTFGKQERPWTWATGGPFGKMRNRMHELKAELNGIAPKEHQNYEYAENVIDEFHSAAPNLVPTWSQPGMFIMWVGYIPVVCIWGGYHRSRGIVLAATPEQPTISDHGMHTMTFNVVHKEVKTVQDFFARALLSGVNVKEWAPATIDVTAQQQLGERLDAIGRAWITAAVKGPHIPDRVVPLPTKFAMRPQDLFRDVAA